MPHGLNADSMALPRKIPVTHKNMLSSLEGGSQGVELEKK